MEIKRIQIQVRQTGTSTESNLSLKLHDEASLVAGFLASWKLLLCFRSHALVTSNAASYFLFRKLDFSFIFVLSYLPRWFVIWVGSISDLSSCLTFGPHARTKCVPEVPVQWLAVGTLDTVEKVAAIYVEGSGWPFTRRGSGADCAF